ncbi:hypothetical protein LXA43DRAFT_374686 [Ganoderma leucocontextum]|nr:hypothetical protein LXA43DRAFT_374686 [Ganoderma leucocontextum]
MRRCISRFYQRICIFNLAFEGVWNQLQSLREAPARCIRWDVHNAGSSVYQRSGRLECAWMSNGEELLAGRRASIHKSNLSISIYLSSFDALITAVVTFRNVLPHRRHSLSTSSFSSSRGSLSQPRRSFYHQSPTNLLRSSAPLPLLALASLAQTLLQIPVNWQSNSPANISWSHTASNHLFPLGLRLLLAPSHSPRHLHSA